MHRLRRRRPGAALAHSRCPTQIGDV